MKNSFAKFFLSAILSGSASLTYGQSYVSAEESLLKEKLLAVNLYIKINAPLDSVWSRWSGEKGIKKFFAPACSYEFKPQGKLEIYFAPTAPKGQRGAEDNMIVGIEEKKMVSFTWDAPPQFPEIRKQRTLVTVRFYATGKNETLVTLSQTGWGQGEDWTTVRNYFGNAWGGFVLPNLKYSLEVKPIDWSDFPKSAPQGLKPAERF